MGKWMTNEWMDEWKKDEWIGEWMDGMVSRRVD